MRTLVVLLIVLAFPLSAATPKRKILLSRLDPSSASQHLAFYQLYPETQEGTVALKRAWALLSNRADTVTPIHQLPSPRVLDSIIALVNRQPSEPLPKMTAGDLATINSLSRDFGNRGLRGFGALTEDEVLALPSEEIDLARGLLLSQQIPLDEIIAYEAMIDLMALQIRSQIPVGAGAEQMVRALNRFIFEEMQFRFPPHSAFAKDIDVYTFLPSVLDSRRGVCLGVSILYICLAQRLNIPLEIITPPGHIYVRYRNGDQIINIETTARGIDVESEQYLSLNTRKLQLRDLKETIGFAHVNQASLYWSGDDQSKILPSYEIARKYIHRDPLIEELYAYALIVNGQEERGRQILRQQTGVTADHVVAKDPLCEDVLAGKTDREGILSCFLMVDEDRASLLKKKEKLETHLKRFPEFRSGLFTLATTLMQLHREGEALDVLKRYHKIDANNPTAEYILCILSAKRHDFNEAWLHFDRAEQIVAARDHKPKALQELRKQLSVIYPE